MKKIPVKYGIDTFIIILLPFLFIISESISNEKFSGILVSFAVLAFVFWVIFGIAFFMIMGTSGFIFFNVFRLFNRAMKDANQHQEEAKQAAVLARKSRVASASSTSFGGGAWGVSSSRMRPRSAMLTA